MAKYELTEEQIAICEDRGCPVEAIEAYLYDCSAQPCQMNDELIKDFCNAYYGQYDSEKSFALECARDAIFSFISDKSVRNDVEMYFDYDAYTRDLFIDSYDFCTDCDGQGHVFAKC